MIKKLLLSFMVLIVLLACELPILSSPDSSIPDVVPIETIIAGTAAAAQTRTALVRPSITETQTIEPIPTGTPTATLTSTATVIFIIPTSTEPFVAHGVGSQCDLIAISPYNPVTDPGTSIDTAWTLKNTGDELWLEHDIDFRHSGGTDMHKKDAYDLPKSVPPTGNVTITVAMIAPNKSGTYTTSWVLVTSKKELCKVSATIIVK